MKNLKRLSLVALLALSFMLLALALSSTSKQVVKADNRDRDGGRADSVVLNCSNYVATTGCQAWSRVKEDGTAVAFTIPSHKELEITDLQMLDTSRDALMVGELGVCVLNLGGNLLMEASGVASLGLQYALTAHSETGIDVTALPTALCLNVDGISTAPNFGATIEEGNIPSNRGGPGPNLTFNSPNFGFISTPNITIRGSLTEEGR